MQSTELQQKVTDSIEKIEQEMRQIGMWQEQPLRPEQAAFKQAFALDTMAFSQWLQFIFIPRVRQAVAANSFPSGSSVGAQAIREFDGAPNADHLVELLCEFDALFE